MEQARSRVVTLPITVNLGGGWLAAGERCGTSFPRWNNLPIDVFIPKSESFDAVHRLAPDSRRGNFHNRFGSGDHPRMGIRLTARCCSHELEIEQQSRVPSLSFYK